MNFVESIKTCFKKYATFSGRASRSEFWWWMLFTFLAGLILGFIEELNHQPENIKTTGVLSIIFSLAILLPDVAVCIRRLHDINRSGWFIAPTFLLLVVPYIGNETIAGVFVLLLILYFLILICFYCKKGTTGDNRFGKDPLAENN